jgi:hypothetical protein
MDQPGGRQRGKYLIRRRAVLNDALVDR